MTQLVDPGRLLDEVATQVGLDDYGHPSFRDGLSALLDASRAAHLTPLGEAALDGSVRQGLANRLRIANWRATHPAVADHEPKVEVIIVGLARTGTTVLSHLLGVDPANRSLRAWEARDSIPPPTSATCRGPTTFTAASCRYCNRNALAAGS